LTHILATFDVAKNVLATFDVGGKITKKIAKKIAIDMATWPGNDNMAWQCLTLSRKFVKLTKM